MFYILTILTYIVLIGFPFLILLTIISMATWRLKWAVLVSQDDLPTDTLKGRHNDWWWILKYIPRSISSFVCYKKDKKPKQILGSNPDWHNQDVPAHGTWCLSWPLHFVFRTQKNFLFALGIRFDYHDGEYYTIRAALKRVDYGV